MSLPRAAQRLGREAALVGVVAATASVGALACGSATSAVAVPDRPAPAATLDGCVRAWDNAQIGNGRRLAGALAAYSDTATMLALAPGECVLVFPSSAGQSSDLLGDTVLETDENGDWDPTHNPDGAISQSGATAIQTAAAGAERDVRVSVPDGTVTAVRGTSLAPLPTGVQIAAAQCTDTWLQGLQGASVNATQLWALTNFTVSCPVALAIFYAWTGDQGRAIRVTGGDNSNGREIIGWRCIGEGRQAHWGNESPAPNATVTCTKGTGLIQARSL